MRRDLGLKRSQGFTKACNMPLKAAAHAGVTGMIQVAVFGEEHLLDLVAPGFQVSERQNLGRRWRGRRLDRSWREGRDILRNGERATRGLVRDDSEFFADFENMAFIAAGRLADDEERPMGGLGSREKSGLADVR
jgi:hypothetical protein